MARVLRRIKARAFRQLLDDARHVDRRQPARLHLPVPIDRTEHRPAVTPACSSHACTTRTGHVSGLEPYGNPILRPCPSWSVLLRRNVIVSPSRVKERSATSRPTNSDRLNAPANPSKIKARSRWPIRSVIRCRDHGPDVFSQRRGFLCCRRANGPPNPLERIPHNTAGRGRIHPHRLMRLCNRVQASLNAPGFQPARTISDIGRHGFRRRGKRSRPVRYRTTRRNPSSQRGNPVGYSPPCSAVRIREPFPGRAELSPPPFRRCVPDRPDNLHAGNHAATSSSAHRVSSVSPGLKCCRCPLISSNSRQYSNSARSCSSAMALSSA